MIGLDAAPYNVSIVGAVPDGLPAFTVPTITYEAVTSLIPIALTIALIGFTESIAVAKSIQKKHKNYEIDASQELLALGIANIGASFFQAFPTMGGFARSAVNDQSGACLLYTSPSPRDGLLSRMPSSA